MSGTIYDNISQAFGNTPLVKLNRLPKAGGAEVLHVRSAGPPEPGRWGIVMRKMRQRSA